MNSLSNVLTTYYPSQNLAELDLIIITFTNESNPSYHKNSFNGVVDAPYADYVNDEVTFKILQPQLKSFIGIAYPIVFTTGAQQDDTREYLKTVLAAFKGTPYTPAETNAIPINPGFTTSQWNTLQTALQGANPYSDDGLENYGWQGIFNRFWNGSNTILDAEQFQEDINDILLGETTTEEITVTVQVPVTTFEFVDGEILEEDIIQSNNSWTMSFDLEDQGWIGWHSYMPNMYMFI